MVRMILVLAGGLLFLAGLAGFLYARFKLKPAWDSIEETYYEFEEAHPAMKRYLRGLRTAMALLAAAMLLLLLAAVF